MPTWFTSLLLAVLIVTIPFTLILKIMLRLPKPLALSHRRWPAEVNYPLIGAITAYVTVFIRSAYYVRGSDPPAVLMQFVIAALAYIFGLVLILRQFSGVYPEYIVTTGRIGLFIRKTVYRNIADVEEVSRRAGEAHLRVITSYGLAIPFTLPARSVPIFYERLKPEL
ncbi:MAG: hypothetical protein DMG13_03310 [Acidobacteria bacterium]|nr:MAG: hypothetical protein DMG13_03310 [Acidobacteriota bacterium]